MYYDDDKVRRSLLHALPDLKPEHLEMEVLDYGERLGVCYRHNGKLIRFTTDTKAKTPDAVSRDLLLMAREKLDLKRRPGRPTKEETRLLNG